MKKKLLIILMGEPGVGKTTIAKKIYLILQKNYKIFHLDGDELRNLYQDYNYDLVNRIHLAKRYLKLMNYLSKQSDIVILSSIMIYPELENDSIFKKSQKFLITRKVNSKREIKKEFSKILRNIDLVKNITLIENDQSLDLAVNEVISKLRLN